MKRLNYLKALSLAWLTTLSLCGVDGIQSFADETAADTATAVNGLQETTQKIDTDGTITKSDENDQNADGKLHLSYDTSGGKWEDPGADPTVKDDNGKHDNGTYTVTIPTLIKYENMHVGTVNTSDDYTVNVRGVIGASDHVNITAETGNPVTNGSESITETTTRGLRVWNASQCYGELNVDGSLKGTDSTDTISLSGEAKSVGTFRGTVSYIAKKLQPNISFMDYLSDNDVPLSSVVKHTSNGEAVYNDYHKLGSYHGTNNGWFGDSITISNYDGIINGYSNIAMTFALESFKSWQNDNATSKASAYVTYADGTNAETVVVSVFHASGSRTMNLSIDPGKTVKEIHIDTSYHDGGGTSGHAWMTDMVLS